MLSLPSLAPRDSYTLWYKSSHSANDASLHSESASSSFEGSATNGHPSQPNGSHPHRRHQALHRSPLARLCLDEEYMERRKHNVQDFGTMWIKPPGIPKSLHQLREEKREMEEHQEAMRREALAQELAEAAAAAEGAGDMEMGELGEAPEEARDLDDDVPEAETTRLDSDSLDSDSSDDEDEEEDEEDDDEVDQAPRTALGSRMPDDVYREALARGEDVRPARFGDDTGSVADDADQSHMLQEEDLLHAGGDHQGDLDMDMGVDLDADIPDADEDIGGYEHTDTEAELSTSDEEDSIDAGDLSQIHPAAISMVRSDGTQNSLDLEGLMARDSSSQIGSSPEQRFVRRHG
ncbi:Apc15p protein-domain-containing protein [Xylogone sp. PMI_703]|nr:Apc15p protein-domain-containing protein [Xylogone sp. PMI_703]